LIDMVAGYVFALMEERDSSANITIGYSACRCFVYLRNYDDQPVQGILAVHSRARDSNRHCYGSDSIPSYGSGHSVLR
jgi:hypothetical protein